RNIVLDPVMISTSGSKLISDGAIDTLMRELVPLARVITPNLSESGEICGFAVTDEADMQKAAETIGGKFPCAVLLKGGHGNREAADLLYDSGKSVWIRAERIRNSNTHGTGCTLSSAIACRLAEGKSLEESVQLAKEYLTGAIAAMLDLGAGAGPLDHGYQRN
ncbi:MAG: hydroxymethylpyrimidine/phosphomethylpyrimidine kinase, partial [Oscillospiraceae bacterium]|nr:hydroxymethylpyrimidine/phosphomethylpyrimidine kinase [Oscillospiraceae bacterium]